MCKPLLLLLSFFVAQICIGQQLIYDSNIPVEKLRVVLEQTRGGKVSDMLTDLEYIPLEGGKGNLINYVMGLEVLDDRVGLISNNDGVFYLYDMKGKLLKKISKIDGFKSPYPNSRQLFFSMRTSNNHFLLQHGAFRAKVDLQGNIIDTLTRKFEADSTQDYVQQEVKLGDNHTYKYYGLYQYEKRRKQDLLALNDSVLIKFNPIDTLEVMYASGNILKEGDHKAFLSAGYNTKIFELDGKGISKIYELVLPLRNTFDYKPVSKLKQSDWAKIDDFFGANRDKVYGIDNILYYKGYLIFRAQRWGGSFWIAYHLERKEVLGLNNIISDQTNDYLPFFDPNRMFVFGDFLYSLIYPSHISSAKSKSMEEGHKMRKEYEDLAKYNNPILVRFKLK